MKIVNRRSLCRWAGESCAHAAIGSVRQQRWCGFTLLEVMIALVILVIACLGLMATITYSVRANCNSQETMLAMGGARQQMEKIMAMPSLTTIQALNNTTFDVAGLMPQGQNPWGKVGSITVSSTTVAATAPATAQTVLDIRISVKWRGIMGDRTYDTSFLVTRH